MSDKDISQVLEWLAEAGVSDIMSVGKAVSQVVQEEISTLAELRKVVESIDFP